MNGWVPVLGGPGAGREGGEGPTVTVAATTTHLHTQEHSTGDMSLGQAIKSAPALHIRPCICPSKTDEDSVSLHLFNRLLFLTPVLHPHL
jgi:hypothetical protein